MALLKKLICQLVSSRPTCSSFAYLGIYILTVVSIFYALIFAASYLPQDSLRQHIQDAHAEGYFADNYPRPSYPMDIFNRKLDMYTECVGLGIAINMHPDVDSLLSMPTHGECSGLSQMVVNKFEARSVPYMRYTHGYQLFLKPLYTFFNIDSVRLVTSTITFSLLILLFVTLRSQLNTAYATVIVLSFFITKSSSVFLLVTHATQFWLVLIGAALAARLHSQTSSLLLFGVIGACDASFSFLNMGSLSLGLPLLCYALTLWKNNDRLEKIIAALFWGGVGWSIGFIVPWLIKWTLLELTLDPTREQLFGVTLDLYPAQSVQMILTALYRNIMGLHWRLGVALCAFLIARKLWRCLEVPSGLWVATLPALVPIVWVCLLPGQSGIMHAFFINVILWPCVAATFLIFLSMPKPK